MTSSLIMTCPWLPGMATTFCPRTMETISHKPVRYLFYEVQFQLYGLSILCSLTICCQVILFHFTFIQTDGQPEVISNSSQWLPGSLSSVQCHTFFNSTSKVLLIFTTLQAVLQRDVDGNIVKCWYVHSLSPVLELHWVLLISGVQWFPLVSYSDVQFTFCTYHIVESFQNKHTSFF